MAVAEICLSPFPPATSPAKRWEAIEYIKAQCGGRAAESDDVACGLGMAAAELVEREAPGAPLAIKNQAVVLMVGYLAQADFGSIRQEEIGPRKVEYVVNHAPAFRLCGAKALLAPWKVRRAGAIG